MAKYDSLSHELQSRGYLSMNKSVKWLKQYHPEVAVSYPTFLKMVHADKINYMKIGGSTRITKSELERYVLHGNKDENEW